ncbi:MAG TPA: radical SAM protein, partial [Elusimicrobiota bacterium]|nr:radical SAM protein [Elusimicrobiota bacterium]
MKRAKKVFFYTFGCKVNQSETEGLKDRWRGRGALPVSEVTRADVCIVNSCTVTARADEECRQFVRRLLRRNRKAPVYVTGCYARRAAADLKALSPRVAVLLKEPPEGLLASEPRRLSVSPPDPSSRSRPFVKIQDGCRARCRYCIVPRVRPRLWNQTVSGVLRKCLSLSRDGYEEIVLTGIRLGLYRGVGPGNKRFDLVRLLERLLESPARFRIRLSSLEVTEVTDPLIRLIQGSPRVCPHLHIPLQSADDGVLREMGRWYRFRDYADRVERLRERVPHCGVTADVLVGYPT